MLSSLHVMIVLWSAVVSRLSTRPKIATTVRYCSTEVGFVVLSPEVVACVEPGVESDGIRREFYLCLLWRRIPYNR